MKLKGILIATLWAASFGSQAFAQGYYSDYGYDRGGISGLVDDARYYLYSHAGDVRSNWDDFTGARRVPGTDYYLGDALRYPMDAWRENLYRPGYNDGQPVVLPWPGRW